MRRVRRSRRRRRRRLGLRRERGAELVGRGRRVTVARENLVGRQAAGLPRLVYGLRVVGYLFRDGRDVFLRLRSHVATSGRPVIGRGSHRTATPGRAQPASTVVITRRRPDGAVAATPAVATAAAARSALRARIAAVLWRTAAGCSSPYPLMSHLQPYYTHNVIEDVVK